MSRPGKENIIWYMISEYKFGSLTIERKTYYHDVEVRWSGEVLDWPRAESHVIDAKDVQRAVAQNPETIVIGNGQSGVAQVTPEAQRQIKSKGIELITDVTEEAVKTFNYLLSQAEENEEEIKVIGLFHLTC